MYNDERSMVWIFPLSPFSQSNINGCNGCSVSESLKVYWGKRPMNYKMRFLARLGSNSVLIIPSGKELTYLARITNFISPTMELDSGSTAKQQASMDIQSCQKRWRHCVVWRENLFLKF
jgi:hypothetical protein